MLGYYLLKETQGEDALLGGCLCDSQGPQLLLVSDSTPSVFSLWRINDLAPWKTRTVCSS